MSKMKAILYVQLTSEMDAYYHEFRQNFYHSYPKLQTHFELLWERRNFWAFSFRSKLHICENNTNNYVETREKLWKLEYLKYSICENTSI